MKRIITTLIGVFTFFLSDAQKVTDNDPQLTEVWNPVPSIITPGKTAAGAPSDAIILFDGKNADSWMHQNGADVKWKVDSGYLMVNPKTGNIYSRKGFGSCQLHIEWRTPYVVKGDGQGRGNSGIFFMSRYELQVLDNFNNRTYSNGQAGSIYKQRMPLVNACRPPGEWQSYDVIFTAPQFNADSTLRSAARITVLHNGVLVQNNTEIWGGTEYIGTPQYKLHSNREPIILQDHDNTLSFRNIWIREL